MFAMPSIRRMTTTGQALRRPRPVRAALAGAIIAAAIAPAPFAAASALDMRAQAAHRLQLAQEGAPDEAPVSADQMNKYIAVYSAMQRDHSLTVDQAASKQGLTVEQFRDIENRIERNPVVHERVMDALKKASKKDQPAK